MARRRRSSRSLSAEQARQALAFLVHEGKLAASEVHRAVDRREKLLREIRERMAELGVGALGLTARVARGASRRIRAARKARRLAPKASPPASKRAKPKISAATRKLYQAQGRYMAAVRQLPKAARARIKAIRAESGVNAAIREAKRRLAEQRFLTRQTGSPGRSENRSQRVRRQDAAPPEPRPDKHGGSGAGRQQGGSGAGRERG